MEGQKDSWLPGTGVTAEKRGTVATGSGVSLWGDRVFWNQIWVMVAEFCEHSKINRMVWYVNTSR